MTTASSPHLIDDDEATVRHDVREAPAGLCGRKHAKTPERDRAGMIAGIPPAQARCVARDWPTSKSDDRNDMQAAVWLLASVVEVGVRPMPAAQ
jgi:hypothetical protein